MKRKVLIIFFILFGLFSIFSVSEANNSTTVFDDLVINNISVSNSEAEIDEIVTYKISYTTTEEISRIDVILENENMIGNFLSTGFYLENGEMIMQVKLNAYGTWKINSLYFQNTNGKTLGIYNTKSSYENTYGGEMIEQDLSSADITIVNNPHDKEAPVIDISSIAIEKNSMMINEKNRITMRVTDNNLVDNVLICIEGEKGNSMQYPGMLKEDGLYHFDDIYGEMIGRYYITYISAVDKSGNETIVVNKNIEDIGVEGQKVDLSYLNFIIKTDQKEEKNAPIIDVKSFKVNKKKTYIRDNDIKWSFSIIDESEIKYVLVSYKLGNYNELCYGIAEKNEEGNYIIYGSSEYYGTYKIASIIVKDIFGNTTVFRNTAFELDEDYLDDPTATGDLSSVDFEVGIYDEKEGIFATGEGLDSDVTMTVEDIEQSGEIFDKLHSKDYNVSKFLEIHMNGIYNRNGNKVRLEFYCGEENEGKKYKIKHLLSTGDIQEEEQIVRNGIIYIWVDEFSPFMIENQDVSGGETTIEETVKENEKTKQLDNEPKTGNNNNASIIAGIAFLIAILGIKFCKKY